MKTNCGETSDQRQKETPIHTSGEGKPRTGELAWEHRDVVGKTPRRVACGDDLSHSRFEKRVPVYFVMTAWKDPRLVSCGNTPVQALRRGSSFVSMMHVVVVGKHDRSHFRVRENDAYIFVVRANGAHIFVARANGAHNDF